MNAQQYISILANLRITELRELAHIVQARTGKTGKRGIRLRLKKAELLREIRRALASTFPDRLERFAEQAQRYVDEMAGRLAARRLILCPGCGRTQHINPENLTPCDFYTCAHGSCRANPAFHLPKIPEGMVREEMMHAAGGFTGYRLRIATAEDREAIARARSIRDMAVAGLYRRGEEV